MTDGARDIEPTPHFLAAHPVPLHYVDWGNHDAPLLVLIHGGLDHARSWDGVARVLRHDWHIVCPDLRGHGDSARSADGNYSIPFYVADLAALLDHLSKEAVSIVAHSLGGAVALCYAGLYPERVRQLIAVEGLGIPLPGCGSRTPVAERWRRWVDARRSSTRRMPRRYPTLEAACARMQEANAHLSPEQVRHLTVHGVRRNDDNSYGWKFDNNVHLPQPPTLTTDELSDLWTRIDCPVWLVHGADSWAQHPSDVGLADRFRHASVTSYADAGHWVHHDRLNEFLKDLQVFLKPYD